MTRLGNPSLKTPARGGTAGGTLMPVVRGRQQRKVHCRVAAIVQPHMESKNVHMAVQDLQDST